MDDDALRVELIKQRRFEEAREVQRRRLAANSQDPALLFQMAWILVALGDLHQAIEFGVKACNLDPVAPQYPSYVSKIFNKLGDSANADQYEAEAKLRTDSQRRVFDNLQQMAAQEARETIQEIVSTCIDNWPYGKPSRNVTARADEILALHLLDSVEHWSAFVPERCIVGQTVEIDGIGRFFITNPKDTIEKRFCRRMPWETPIIALLLELAYRCDPDALIVEIGANIGSHTVPLARGFQGQVVAFEPVSATYQRLLGHLRLNGIENCIPIQKACSSEPGRGRMVRGQVDNPGLAQLEISDSGPVDVTMLDIEAASFARPIAILKIDVEGHEHAVLQGAWQTLLKDRPLVICELLHGAAEQNLAIMKSIGYGARKVFRSDWLFFPL